MWNPDVHGAGHASLNIQGRTELLPVKPGETLPGYDNLEFKMVRSYVSGQAVNRIVCEGIVVDPPKRRIAIFTSAAASHNDIDTLRSASHLMRCGSPIHTG
jgi:hypothetical protein